MGRVIWWRPRPRRRLVLVVRDAAAPVELRPRDLLRWVGPVRALEVATWAGADPVFLRPLVRALARNRAHDRHAMVRAFRAMMA